MWPLPNWRERGQPVNFVGRLANVDRFIPHSNINGDAGLLTIGQLGPGPAGVYHTQVTTNVGLAGVPSGATLTQPLSTTTIGP